MLSAGTKSHPNGRTKLNDYLLSYLGKYSLNYPLLNQSRPLFSEYIIYRADGDIRITCYIDAKIPDYIAG